MNKTTEALKLAGKALGCSQQHLDLYHPEWVITRQQNDKALAAIREALAEHEKQKPVAWYKMSKTGDILLSVNCVEEDWIPLYAAPVSAKREFVELTDDELKAALEVHQVGLSIRIGRIAIAAFKEKNK